MSEREEFDWIACSERLPTKEDEDIHGKVWGLVSCLEPVEVKMFGSLEISFFYKRDRAITHWMPTGLRKPEPPQERKQ